MGEGSEREKERVKKVGGVIDPLIDIPPYTLFSFLPSLLSPYIPYNITPLPYNRPRSEAK